MDSIVTYGEDDRASFGRTAEGGRLLYYNNVSVLLDPGSWLVALLDSIDRLNDRLAGSQSLTARRDAEISELRAQLAAAEAAARPKRYTVMTAGNEHIFADIRAAFVDKDGTITRTLNGAPMPVGTDLYVLGDIIE